MKTEDLLRKYVEQGLGSDERFELEKRALDDDFLAEAWEGLQLHQGSDLQERWTSIQAQWKQRSYTEKLIQETKVVSMRSWLPYAAAAAVLLLMASVFLFNPNQGTAPQASTVAMDTEAIEGEAATILVEDYEETVKEEAIVEAAEKTSKIINREPARAISNTEERTQKKTNGIAIAESEAVLPSTNTADLSNTLTPIQIPNPKPTSEGRAALALDKKVEDFDTAEIPNADVTSIEIEDRNKDLAQAENGVQRKLSLRTPSGAPIAYSTQPKEEGLALQRSIQQLVQGDNDPFSKAKALYQDYLNDRIGTSKNSGLDKLKEAREQALKAIDLDLNQSDAYVLISDIYKVSAQNCGDSWNQSLAILAASEKLQTAKTKTQDSQKIASINSKLETLREDFPTKDDGFMRGAESGDTATVACWIDEKVTIQYR